MKLRHSSSFPIDHVRDTSQDDPNFIMKPVGLWLSDDDEFGSAD